MNQRTIKSPVTTEGLGIHSGNEVKITLKPADIDTGIIFIRTDLNNIKVHANPSTIHSTKRATHLK